MEGVFEEKYDYNCTIGFYGPKNGPFPRDNSSGLAVYPYVVMRYMFKKNVPWGEKAGEYHYNFIDNMIIDRTGNKISDPIQYEYRQNNKIKYFTPSFHISVSGDRLTISKGEDFSFLLDKATTFIKDPSNPFSSDPNLSKPNPDNPVYTPGSENNPQVWSQVCNTAWTKLGDSKPSVGFYERNYGPGATPYGNEVYGYVYYRGVGGVGASSLSNFDGIRIDFFGILFYITVSNNGNTLIISTNYVGDPPWFNIEDFIGTYTKTSSNPYYNWDW